MSESQVTKRIGALVFFGVFIVYFATMAPTTSFWDCGEFIAAAFSLGVPHPPGSPLYNLLGRFFSLFPIEAPLKAIGLLPDFADMAVRVNIMSPIAGALSALFAYLIILRLIRGWSGALGRDRNDWTAQVGAVAGALIFAFADSNWFNAVEAEVYAYAIFLMMLVLWLGLKWADSVGDPKHLSYALAIAYIVGLAGGLHMLCLLVLPSIGILALFTYVPNRRDTWVLLTAAALLAIGGYFGLHFLNAVGLEEGPMSAPAYTFGIAETKQSYITRSFILALIPGLAGLFLTFRTKTVAVRDTWTVLLIAAAAGATVQVVMNVFYWYQGVASFPSSMIVIGVASGVGLLFLRNAASKPSVPILKGYHLSVALLVLVVLGYSTYLTLMIRSGLNPIIDENNPENWKNFFDFVARKQYGTESMSLIIFERRANFGWQFWDMLFKYLFQQFPASITGTLFDWKIFFRAATEPIYFGMRVPDLPLLLMFFGLLWQYESDKKRFLALVSLWTIGGIGLAVYLNMPDPQPRERHYVFTAAASVMALWMGMGITGLIRAIPTWIPNSVSAAIRTRLLPVSAAVIGLFVPVWFLVGYPLVDEYSTDRSVRYTNWTKQNRHLDTVAYDYAYNILQSCDPNGILFTNGDNDTFPLWYLQEVVGVRRDVRVVNLSLLNTDWYIQQLRDNEPKLPISARYTDDFIVNVLTGSSLEALVRSNRIDVVDGSPFNREGRLVGWQTKDVSAAGVDTARITLASGEVVRGVVRDIDSPEISVMPHETRVWQTFNRNEIADIAVNRAELVWTLAAQPDFPVLRVQDVMVYNIVHWVKWERPVYFAVTVSADNRIGLDPYLRMEGMVLKVGMEKDPTVEPGSDMYGLNPERSAFNLDSVYVMRYLMDQSIYKDDNMQKLISNYRSAYLQLADTYLSVGETEKAAVTLRKLIDRLPLDWRSSYSAASIVARRNEPTLDDLSRHFAQHAGTVLARHLEQEDLFGSFMIQQARMTAQLLRFTSGGDSTSFVLAADLLTGASERLNESPNATLMDHLALSFDAAMAYEDAGQLHRAYEIFSDVDAALATLATRPDVAEQLRSTLQMDPNRLVIEVQRKLTELEEEIRLMNALETPSDTSRMDEN